MVYTSQAEFAGFSTITVGFSEPQMRQFCVFDEATEVEMSLNTQNDFTIRF